MCTVFGTISRSVDRAHIMNALKATKKRGPDDERIIQIGQAKLGFQRLAIMDLNSSGMQPFLLDDCAVVCNGELYGFRKIKNDLIDAGYPFDSNSDCEILIPMYLEHDTSMFSLLDGEYACILYDNRKKRLIAARDPMGIRPLYFGYGQDGNIILASEPKNLTGLVDQIFPFPPGHYFVQDDEHAEFVCFADLAGYEPGSRTEWQQDLEAACAKIHDLLTDAVLKRLDADAPCGFLLSGGLDSSLVCAIAQKASEKPIRTFAIGMQEDAIDLKYARQAADYIGSDHTEFTMTMEDVLKALDEVIEALATFDITTIRASLPMYLLCQKIRENTDIRVLLSGEISDELFGYKYTDFAPSDDEFQKESCKRVRELHMYDVLRADRCIASHSMEARVPFSDRALIEHVMSIDPFLKRNRYGIGKYLLRHAFEQDEILPGSLLMREKAAFSDAVGHSMADHLKEKAEQTYTDEEFQQRAALYDYARPFTKEALLYREIFEKHYPGQAQMIAGFWMPNQSWPGCAVQDPSARVLPNYGNSGQ